jgi:hypothetical protein
MSISAIAIRRPISAVSGQTLLLGACAVAAAVWVGLVGLQSQHAFLHEAAPVLLAPLALWFFFSERYDVTLAVLLLYLGLLDGVVKLASGSQLATLVRDVLLYAMVLGALARMVLRQTQVEMPPFAGFVFAWAAVCLMELANPLDVSLVHALAALRQHLEFLPLFFLGYYILRTERRVVGLLLLLAVVGAANGIVDLIQSLLTPAQLAAWGPGYAGLEFGTATRVARVFVTAGGQAHVRPPGLGGTDGFGGMVCLMALPAVLGLLSTARRSAKYGWLLLPVAVLAIVGVVTSQTRLAVVDGTIAVIAFLMLTVTSRRGVAALLLTSVVMLGGYLSASAFISSNANRYSSIAPSNVLSTSVSTIGFHGTFLNVPKYVANYPLGAGLGTVGPAGQSTIGGFGDAKGLNGESEVTFLLLEAGVPGLLVMLTFTLAIIRAGLRLRRTADPNVQRPLMALTAVVIALLVAWVINLTTADSPTGPFIWVSAGCLAYWHRELRSGRVPVRVRRFQSSLV